MLNTVPHRGLQTRFDCGLALRDHCAHRDRPHLARAEGIDSAAYHEIMAIAVLGMIPAALIFLFFQRSFVRGIALSGLKE